MIITIFLVLVFVRTAWATASYSVATGAGASRGVDRITPWRKWVRRQVQGCDSRRCFSEYAAFAFFLSLDCLILPFVSISLVVLVLFYFCGRSFRFAISPLPASLAVGLNLNTLLAVSMQRICIHHRGGESCVILLFVLSCCCSSLHFASCHFALSSRPAYLSQDVACWEYAAFTSSRWRELCDPSLYFLSLWSFLSSLLWVLIICFVFSCLVLSFRSVHLFSLFRVKCTDTAKARKEVFFWVVCTARSHPDPFVSAAFSCSLCRPEPQSFCLTFVFRPLSLSVLAQGRVVQAAWRAAIEAFFWAVCVQESHQALMRKHGRWISMWIIVSVFAFLLVLLGSLAAICLLFLFFSLCSCPSFFFLLSLCIPSCPPWMTFVIVRICPFSFACTFSLVLCSFWP